MKNDKLNVGFITTFSGRWPRELPEKRLAEYGAWLRENLPANTIIYNQTANTMQQVNDAVDLFRREKADLIVMMYGAFTGDDFPCALADGVGVPLVLWAPKEPTWDRDDRLYANAMVAATMNAAALHRIKKPYHVLYGGMEDARAVERIKALVRAYTLIKQMKGTLFGLFGYRPTAFYNCAFDEALIRKTFGVRMEETDLKMVFDRMAALDYSKVEADMRQEGAQFDPSGLPEGHAENHSRLYLALKELMTEQGYDVAAIKCWPEMGSLHTTPCAVLGRLADEGMELACEGDIDAGLAMLMEHYLTGKPVFVTDMIDMNEEASTLTYWHCGNAAPSLFDVSDGVDIRNHPLAGQGTALYGVLKPGPVTIARMCNIRGQYKLFLLRGQAIKSTRRTRGVMVDVKVERPVRKVFETIIGEGVAHHYSIVWQDIADDMRLAAELLGVEVIEG